MAGLKEIRTRISSISSTQKITSAMKMVSAAKFHKAQDVILHYSPYSKKIQNLLARIVPIAPDSVVEKWFTKPEKTKNAALVVVTSNSSMCGGFNLNLLKYINEEAPKHFPELWGTSQMSLFCLGKKGADYLRKKGLDVDLIDTDVVNNPSFNISATFCSNLIEDFKGQKFDSIHVAYNYFRNPALQEPRIEPLLPFTQPGENSTKSMPHNLIFEPDQEYILNILIPLAIKTYFHNVILENSIGEHGARMTAMHQATENAIELTKELKLQYNKARQAAITKEILEIVSGAEALKG
ncbi:MAG: ATP synthase F1 subunit gamma [Perlabentimonas sp.]